MLVRLPVAARNYADVVLRHMSVVRHVEIIRVGRQRLWIASCDQAFVPCTLRVGYRQACGRRPINYLSCTGALGRKRRADTLYRCGARGVARRHCQRGIANPQFDSNAFIAGRCAITTGRFSVVNHIDGVILAGVCFVWTGSRTCKLYVGAEPPDAAVVRSSVTCDCFHVDACVGCETGIVCHVWTPFKADSKTVSLEDRPTF